jgi:surfeit locus 1 family protein
MRRLPLVPTFIVAIAVPMLLALGVWQLQRASWKAQLLDRYAANADAPAIDAPRSLSSLADTLAFRRVRVLCDTVEPRSPVAGRTQAGAAGYRQQILCRRRNGEALFVSVGVASDPTTRFTGRLVPRAGAPRFVLIAERPVPPLAAEAPPTLDTIPNNHAAYAAQWFFFALTLGAIYVLYLRRTRSVAGAGGSR